MISFIKKGNHYPTLWSKVKGFGFTTKNNFRYSIRFDKSCLYDLKSSDNFDCNKLCGVSTSYSHMQQSARFGWRCTDNKNIEILSFVHDNGTFLEPHVLGVVSVDEWFECSIDIYYDVFTFKFLSNSIKNEFDVKISKKAWNLKYNLGFYFGGNCVSPHDMFVDIKRI